jgi:hypothetical protein
MNVYPVFSRELKQAIRKPIHYWLRTGTVVVGIGIGIALLSHSSTWPASASLGREIFRRVTAIVFGLCLFSGVLLSSNLLCEERREGSLTLLFLTRVTGLDVIIAKLGTTALLACQIVLALFPLMALCMVLGGVSGAEFARAVQVLSCTLMLSLSVGVFISALNRSMGRAALISFFAISIGTLLLSVLDDQMRRLFPAGSVGIIVPGPIQLFQGLGDLEFRLSPNGFPRAIAFQWSLFGALLSLAGLMLKRLCVLDGSGRVKTRKLKDFSKAWARRRLALHRNPVHWLISRQRGSWLGNWLLVSVLLLGWTSFLEVFENQPWTPILGLFVLGPLVHILLKVAIISEAAECLASVRRPELELLLVSPLSVGKIIHGLARALLRRFAGSIATVFFVDLMIVLFYRPPHMPFREPTAFLFIFALSITMLVDLPALIWRGLWNGLRSRHALSAMRRTMMEVLLVPVVVFAACLAISVWFSAVLAPFLGLFGMNDVIEGPGEIMGTIVLWWVVAFVLNAFLQRNARHHLGLWLRYIASGGERYAGRSRRHHSKFRSNQLPGFSRSRHPALAGR